MRVIESPRVVWSALFVLSSLVAVKPAGGLTNLRLYNVKTLPDCY